jgi:tetratricopeptide (TPR) repeat protein
VSFPKDLIFLSKVCIVWIIFISGIVSATPVPKDNHEMLILRSGYHDTFTRVVFEGPGSLISKAQVNQRDEEIVVNFPDPDITVGKKKLSVAYRVDNNKVIFSPKNYKKVRTFFLSKPDRLVIDIYHRDKEKNTSMTLKTPQVMSKKEEARVLETKKEIKNSRENNNLKITGEKKTDEEFIPEEYQRIWKLLNDKNYYNAVNELKRHRPEDVESIAAYHYLQGIAYEIVEKYLDAIKHLRLAYIYARNNKLRENALIKRAEIYFKVGLLYEARADYTVFIKNFHSSEKIRSAHLGLARCLSKIGLFKEAVKHYEKAGKSPEALFGKANALQKLGKIRAAKIAYARAMRVDSTYPEKSPETYFLIGENMRLSGELKKAKEHLIKIVTGPYKDHANISLGLIALKESDTDEAIKYFKSASYSKSRQIKVQAFFNLAMAILKTGQIEEAIKGFEEIRHNYIDSSVYKDTLFILSKLYRTKGEIHKSVALLKELIYGKDPPAEAFSELEKIILEVAERSEQDPAKDKVQFVKLWKEMGPWLIDQSREKFLLKVARRLRHEGEPFLKLCSWLVENALKHARVVAAGDLADYYIGIGNVQAAQEYMSIVKKAKDSSDRTLRIEAKIFHATGDYKKAFQKLRLIKKLKEEDLDYIEKIIREMNRPDSKIWQRALAFYEKILNSSEWNAENYIKLADILYENGKKRKALKYYRIAYQKKPDDEWTIYRLGIIAGMPESERMFSQLQKNDSLLSRLAKTKLMEIALLNKLEEVY